MSAVRKRSRALVRPEKAIPSAIAAAGRLRGGKSPSRTPAALPTRTRLLETAQDLIWEHSYASVSVDAICRRAGVLKGSFYHFFPSKADLAVAALEYRWANYAQPKLEKAFAKARSPHERLSRYYDFIYETQRIQRGRVGRTCGCAFASIGAEQAREEERIRRKTQEVFSRYLAFIRDAMEDAVRDGTLSEKDLGPGGVSERAREAFSFVHGILLQARVENDLGMVKRFKSAFLRVAGVRPA
ncbi:MAG TPA: TetR/AcrR family transcriptional regulator [Candidatus Methylacidiphilales bacterium]